MYRPNLIPHVCVGKNVRDQLFEEETFTMKVNLGCGHDYIEGYINVDGHPSIKADMHFNLDNPELKLPWKDGEVHLFYCAHILEHITHLIHLKSEMIRCLEPGGVIVVVVPNFDAMDAWGDDTHVRAFSRHSFYPDYWPGCHMVKSGTFEVTDSWDNKNKWLYGVMQKQGLEGQVSI